MQPSSGNLSTSQSSEITSFVPDSFLLLKETFENNSADKLPRNQIITNGRIQNELIDLSYTKTKKNREVQAKIVVASYKETSVKWEIFSFL